MVIYAPHRAKSTHKKDSTPDLAIEKKIPPAAPARWVYARLRCEPWRPWGWGETTRGLLFLITEHPRAAGGGGAPGGGAVEGDGVVGGGVAEGRALPDDRLGE